MAPRVNPKTTLGGSPIRLPLGLLIAVVFISAPARAADPFSNILGGAAPVAYGFYYSTEASPQSGTTSAPGVYENRIRGVVPISKGDTDTWGLQTTLGNLHFGVSPVFTDTGASVSENFWDAEVGATYRHRYEENRELSANFSVGSVGDVPFNTINETIFQFNGTYRWPGEGRHSWFLLVNWSNNRTFLNYVPIPGVGYSYRSEDKRFTYVLGFPVNMVYWEIAKGFYGRASFTGISQANAEIGKELFFPLRLYGAFDWGQRVWLPAGRADLSDRLFFDQAKASVGLRSPLSPYLFADLSVGYEFARRLFLAHSYYSPLQDGKLAIDSGWTALLSVSVRDLKQMQAAMK